MTKDSKGITLIALVITIIVLLILAGVSIAMLTGGNGLLTKATEARVDNYRGQVCDKINTALNAVYAEQLSHQYGVGTLMFNKEDKGATILSDNGLDTASLTAEDKKIGKYEASTSEEKVTITWTATDTDYGDPITGEITKTGTDKVPYKVTPAVVRKVEATTTSSSTEPSTSPSAGA